MQALFLTTFMVAGCSDSLPVRWVLKPKSLSFFQDHLSFFQYRFVFGSFCHFLNFGEGNLFKIYQTWIFLVRFAQILGILKFMMAISLPVHWVFLVKSEIATSSLNFGPKKALSFYICWVFFSLSFRKSGQKKAWLRGHLAPLTVIYALKYW